MSLSEELLAKSRIIVMVGAGGVGKTTSSIVMAVAGALEGKRVGLLSIDPAKRLAAALGMELGSELRRLDLGSEVTGSIDAAMLDQKAVFDEMVIRFAKSETSRQRILNHSIYQAASEKFGGALEYMALAKLEKMAESGVYDLIVLDTPPDAHALDFLVKPNILAGFMDNGVMQWLIRPIHFASKMGLGRLLTMGEKLAGGIAEVTGVKAIQVLAEFLVLMQDVIDGFHGSGEKALKHLRSSSTAYVLVTTLRSSAVRSALHMAQQLKAMGYAIDRLLINRTIPLEVSKSIAHLPDELSRLGASRDWLEACYNSYRVALSLEDKLLSNLQRIFGAEVAVQRIAEQAEHIHSRTSVLALARAISQN